MITFGEDSASPSDRCFTACLAAISESSLDLSQAFCSAESQSAFSGLSVR